MWAAQTKHAGCQRGTHGLPRGSVRLVTWGRREKEDVEKREEKSERTKIGEGVRVL